MASRLVNLLTFGLANRRSGSVDGLSASTSRRVSTVGGDHGDYSSYSNNTIEEFPTDPSLSTTNSPLQPPSPDPHEAYILPPSYPSPAHNVHSNSRTPSSQSPLPGVPHSSASSLTPVLTGDATLDLYKTELDLLSREVDHIRGSITAYARQLIRMGLQATDVAEKAYDVCEASNFFPVGMKIFMKVHRGWSEEAAFLFSSQLEEEILQPLKDWDEEVDQFIRELMRVNQVRLTMKDYKKRVDALFLKKCDSPKTWTEEEEGQLKVEKSDLEATCNHYTGRCEGLVSHWKSLALGRMTALDLLFTRLMTQQYALFQPAIQALLSSGIYEPADKGAQDGGEGGTHAGGGGGAVGPEASPLTPPTPSGRLRAYSGDGYNVRKRSLDPFDDGDRRAAQLSHFSAPRMLRKREQERRRKERERREQEEEDSDDEDKQDAILRTLELMKEEIREKERLQREMEQLLSQQHQQIRGEGSEEAQHLRERLLELERKLEAKEAEIARDQKQLDEAKEEGTVIGTDAPPPPPLDGDVPPAPPMGDVPTAPPMDGVPPAPPMNGVPHPEVDGVPLALSMGDVPAPPPGAPPTAPSFGGGGFAIKKLTPREKELAEARKYHLPILPAMRAVGDVAVKRLHWTVVGGAEVKGTVWEELFSGGEDAAKESGDWDIPLIKTEEAADTSGGTPLVEWQWPLGEDFGQTFSQKAAKPMARKGKKKKARRHGGSGAASTTADDDEADEEVLDEDEEAKALRDASEAKLKKQLEKVELIDAKRAYNVAISLSRFRLDFPLIRNAVMAMDSEVLSSEMLEVLVDILPTTEEVKIVKEYEGDPDILGDVERFFLCMSVPTLSTRLKSFLFLQSFSSVTSALQDALDCLQRVNERLRESKGLKAVLGIILRMGNYMTACNGHPQYTAQHCPQIRHFTNDLAGVRKPLHPSRPPHLSPLSLLLSPTPLTSPPLCPSLFVSQCRAGSRIESAFLVAEVKQLQQNLRMVRQLIEDDEKRRGSTPRSLAARFTFAQPGIGPTDPTTAFSPLSDPSTTSLHALTLSPDPSDVSASSSFSFPRDAPTPASANVPLSSAVSLPPLPERVYSFYAYARQRVGEIERQLLLVQKQYEGLQRLLLWEEVAWETLYGLFAQFLEEWLTCEQEMEMQRQAELRRKRQQETTEAMQRKKAEATAKKEKDREEVVQLAKWGQSTHSVNGEEWREESKGEVEKSGTSQGDSGGSTPPVFSLELDPAMDDHELP